MKTCEFEKLGDCWFIVLPEYLEQGGEQADLAMVAGADTLLEMIAEGRDRVKLVAHTQPLHGAEVLERTELLAPGQGANYHIKTLNGIEINLDIWLCAVTEFVFGNMPETIYFKPFNKT